MDARASRRTSDNTIALKEIATKEHEMADKARAHAITPQGSEEILLR